MYHAWFYGFTSLLVSFKTNLLSFLHISKDGGGKFNFLIEYFTCFWILRFVNISLWISNRWGAAIYRRIIFFLWQRGRLNVWLDYLLITTYWHNAKASVLEHQYALIDNRYTCGQHPMLMACLLCLMLWKPHVHGGHFHKEVDAYAFISEQLMQISLFVSLLLSKCIKLHRGFDVPREFILLKCHKLQILFLLDMYFYHYEIHKWSSYVRIFGRKSLGYCERPITL